MELSVKKSALHFAMIFLCFGWAAFALWYSGIPAWAKYSGSVFLIVACLYELSTWLQTPLSISIRRQRIYLHFSSGEVKKVELSKTSIQLFWVKLRLGRTRLAIYLFHDSFTREDWRELKRTVRYVLKT